MKNINIGVANLVVSDKLRESMFDDSLLVETKNTASKFFDVVKNSPVLQLEFKVFNSIENKHINSDALIPNFIDKNVRLFETYTLEELSTEHDKLKPFIGEAVIENEKIALYEAITTLIEESLKLSENVNIDKMHEAFDLVLDHIRQPKEDESTNIVPEIINEEVIEIAINKFNEKYESMNEEDVKLFKKLVVADNNMKEELFEEFKEENVAALEKLNEDNSNDKIAKSLEKINEMTFNVATADSDIVKLYELKKAIL